MNTKTKKLLLSLGLPFGVGATALIISAFTDSPFELLSSPFFSLTIRRFRALWMLKMLFSGLAFSRILTAVTTDESRRDAVSIFIAQLFLDFIWPLLFFCVKEYTFSLLWIAVKWVSSYVALQCFKKIDKLSGILIFPCLVLDALMIYFNLGVWISWNLF